MLPLRCNGVSKGAPLTGNRNENAKDAFPYADNSQFVCRPLLTKIGNVPLLKDSSEIIAKSLLIFESGRHSFSR